MERVSCREDSREAPNLLRAFSSGLWRESQCATKRLENKTGQQNPRGEKNKMLRSKRMNGIAEVLEEVEFLIDTRLNEFYETESSQFMKNVTCQGWSDARIFKKTWRTLNCTPKTMKVNRGIEENLLLSGRGRSLSPNRRLRPGVSAVTRTSSQFQASSAAAGR